MRNPRTTISGSIAALAAAIAQASPSPSAGHNVALIVACLAGVAFANFAEDAEPAPRVNLGVAGGVLFALVVVAVSGCTVAQFSLGLNNTPFGSLRTSVGGGTIGKTQQTNGTNFSSAGWTGDPCCCSATNTGPNPPPKEKTP